MKKIIFICSLLCLTSLILFAQKESDKKWDVNNPPGKYKEIELAVNEGTWMNLDVSPDNKTLVFDMLGDIYSVSLEGGVATVLRSGLAWEVQPRFSPDGRQILFTSDAGGGDNIWVMNADGSDARQITKEDFRLLNNAVWMPDGQYIVARKHFTSTRSLGAGEMWMYHISGGSGIQLTERKNDQQDVNEPSVSADGRYVYFSEDVYPGGYFQYNKDPNDQIFAIKRYDREKGKVETVIGGPGGACRPQISHDGKKLAYVRRIRTRSVLFIHDLETGMDYPIFDGLSKDQQEAWTIFGVYTGFDWTSDDKNIVIWGKGKIWKVNVDSKEAAEIPFAVKAKHKIAETVKFKQEVAPETFEVKTIRQFVTAPDGKYAVFNAVGHLWTMSLPDGKPKRMTQDEHFEFEPAFSPDGSKLVFSSWDDEKHGALHIMDIASGSTRKITDQPGIYRTPAFSPDGKTLVYLKEGGNNHQGYSYNKEPGIYMIPAVGGEAELVSKEGEYPVFSADGKKVFYQTGGYLFGSLAKAFKYKDLESKEVHTVFTSKYANRYVPSPDNRWVAFIELHNVYVAAMPLPGQAIDLSKSTKAIPLSKVSRDAGINLHWTADSKEIRWTIGNEFFSAPLTERFLFLDGAVDSIPPIDTAGQKIELVLPSDKPEGRIAFTGARLITMEGDEVIENGTILVKDNVIEKLGPADKVRIPRDAKVYDVKGKTIMPGIVDVHAHLGAFRFGQSPQKHWQYYANLAYGVTTTHDPSSNSEMTFSQSEMVKAGVMVGPRIYSTGTILYGADGDFKAVINSLDDARSAIRRTKAFGSFSVKSYNQPRRDQRQQVIQAARELGIMVYPEGGSFFYHNMSMVADGHTSVEHNIPVAPLYDDVIQFWSQTGTANTPTLIVNYGGINGEFYWYQHTNVWEKERLLAFTPRSIVDSRSRHRVMVPEEEYENGHILTSKSCTKLQRSGVDICLGSHGQLQGLGAHWELWMLHQGGMTEMEALRSATLNGARYIGMDEEIGSLKEGKLADLIVIDGNPLENLFDTEKVAYTMINGRLYDAANMNEIGNYDRKRTQFYWEMEGSGNAYPFFNETGSFMRPQCACRH
jgi:imidazolonepropionase-like amidohydrolase/Tol biopolymer transport system component